MEYLIHFERQLCIKRDPDGRNPENVHQDSKHCLLLVRDCHMETCVLAFVTCRLNNYENNYKLNTSLETGKKTASEETLVEGFW